MDTRARNFHNQGLKFSAPFPDQAMVPANRSVMPEKGLQTGGYPLKSEVQLGRRTGGKKGAPFGNRNRLLHGRYTRACSARKREYRMLRRGTRNLICRLGLLAKARKALLSRRLRKRNSAPAQWDGFDSGGL